MLQFRLDADGASPMKFGGVMFLPRRGRPEVWLGLALFVVLVTQYASALTLSFSNDDFIILDKVRHSTFASLWSPQDLLSNYYRPWSREFHYWVLTRVFGIDAMPFHVASFTLWLGIHLTYFAFLRKHLCVDVSSTATCFSAALAAWGVLLVWPAGSQDLWSIGAGLVCLYAFANGHTLAATVAFAISLMSKETAVTLPLIAGLYAWLVERQTPRQLIHRIVPFVPIIIAWAVLHPHMGGGYRPWGILPQPISPVVGLTLRQLVNLDVVPQPTTGWLMALLVGLPAATAMTLVVARTLRTAPSMPPPPPDSRRERRMAIWGACWAILGWLPLIAPGVRWHAYYAIWGALGAWVAITVTLRHRRWFLVAALLAVALIRPARTTTAQDDLGSEWYHRRAARITETIRRDLAKLRPSLEPHSRAFFALVPGGVGLIVSPGYSPSLNVWYADTTLRGYYYSHYAPRSAEDVLGRDHFFVADASGHLVEVIKGKEPIAGLSSDRDWMINHYELAMLLFNAGDIQGCAGEFEKLVAVHPDSSNFVHNLAVCYDYLGARTAAHALYQRAAELAEIQRRFMP